MGLPGVQVLFAFLLTVPFTQRYTRLDGIQRDIYFLAVVSTAMATAFLIAPSSYHRLRWRQHDKVHMLETGNRLAIAGIAFLIDRTNGGVDFGLPFFACHSMTIDSYDPADCPLCRQGLPLVET